MNHPQEPSGAFHSQLDGATGGQPARQSSLPLDAPPLPAGTPLLPARMVNEYVYCPRLAYLEWVQGEWADSVDTVEGRHSHRRVDKARGTPPTPAAQGSTEHANDEDERIHVHSLELSSDALGLIAKLDLAEFEGRRAVGQLPPRHRRRRARARPGATAGR